MNTNQSDSVTMFVTVDDYVTSFLSILDPIPFFMENEFVLKNSIPKIRATAKEQEISFKGMTKNKNKERSSLIVNTIKTVYKLVPFAEFTNNISLSGEITITEAQLIGKNENKLLSFCQNVYDKANLNLDKLSLYGVNIQTQTALNEALKAFTKANDEIKLHRVQHSQLTALLAQQISVADEALLKMDKAILAIKHEQPEIYNGYKTARKVIPSSNATLSFKGLFLYAETDLPLRGVNVIFKLITVNDKPATAKPFTKKSAKKGGIILKNIPDGTYELTIMYEGYITQVITIIIITGKMTKLTVKMAKK